MGTEGRDNFWSSIQQSLWPGHSKEMKQTKEESNHAFEMAPHPPGHGHTHASRRSHAPTVSGQDGLVRGLINYLVTGLPGQTRLEGTGHRAGVLLCARLLLEVLAARLRAARPRQSPVDRWQRQGQDF